MESFDFVPTNSKKFISRHHMAFSNERHENGRPKENVSAARHVVHLTTEAIKTGGALPLALVPKYLQGEYLVNVGMDRVLFENFGKPMFESKKRYNWLTGYPTERVYK